MTTQLTPLAQRMYDLLNQHVYLAAWHIADELGIDHFGVGLPENEGSKAMAELINALMVVELPGLAHRYQVNPGIVFKERNDLRQTVSQMSEALEAVTAERDELQQVVDDLSAEVNRLVNENERLKKEFLADFVPNEGGE